MNVKITFFFEGVQQATKYASAAVGWTETFYGFSNTLTSLDKWLTSSDVLTFLLLRRNCMPVTYRIAWLRVSDELNPRSFKVMALAAQDGAAISTKQVGEATIGLPFGQVQCALLVDLVRLPDNVNDHTHHRKFLMRGLPTDVINGNIIDNTTPNFQAIQAFLNFIAFQAAGEGNPGPPGGKRPPNTTLGLRYQAPAQATWGALPAIAPVVGDPRSIGMSGVLFIQGNLVQIRHVPDSARDLNRTWTVRQVSAGPPPTAVLGRARKDLENATYTPPGPAQYRVWAPIYNLFNEYTIIGLRSKKTGRLFRLLRGRSSNR